jgi:type I restriction enzyme S subunit
MKPGYKQTEVGVIPEDWEVKPLAAIADKIMVGIASAATHAYRTRGVPMFRNQNIKDGHLDDSDLLFVDPEYEAVFRNKRLRSGDLLTMRTGYPGVTAIVPPHYDSAQSFTTLITRPKQDEAESIYLCHFINSEIGQRFFTQSQIGGAQKNVNAGTLRQMLIPLPKPIEQRAIAAALSDVDGLLGALDRLIAKKRDLKQAAMQQLLTGQTRLPGFKGEWVVKTLGEIGSFTKGSGVKKDESQSGSLPCIRYGEIYTRHHDYIKEFYSFISAEVAATASLLKQGDILFAGSGETKTEIGKCVAFVDGCEAYAGGDIVILRPQGVDSLFLGFSLNTPAINRQKASRGQGDAVVHIGSSALADITLNLPPLAEQTAIAAVLSDMDAELAALEQRREKTRALKQGMMQELLTGRTRLI